ncbi:MAG: dihydropteroate synthase [Eubacterium sp.]|nr:dihydropteroate synthase [Eubacterium sp.]
MRIGTKEFDTKNKTYVMGILNMTPDSFSDGGKWNRMDRALAHAEQMIREGADLIDVGGESTRPGYVQVTDEEEIERTAPVIEQIRARFDIPISIDTYKSAVAKEAVAKGADLVNDIWGLKYDAALAGVIADTGAACCLMHNRRQAETHPYQNLMQDLVQDLQESVAIADSAGIRNEQIILDPGIGFAKTYENNLEIIRSLEQLQTLGFPVLLGASRKSVIGLSLDLPASERLEGTLVTTVFAVMKQCAFVRVHDVKENVRAVRMAEAIAGKYLQQFRLSI